MSGLVQQSQNALDGDAFFAMGIGYCFGKIGRFSVCALHVPWESLDTYIACKIQFLQQDQSNIFSGVSNTRSDHWTQWFVWLLCYSFSSNACQAIPYLFFCSVGMGWLMNNSNFLWQLHSF